VTGALPEELKHEIESLVRVSGWSISRFMTRAAVLGFEQAKAEALEDVKKHYERFLDIEAK
jgi:hypothetical protein